MLRRIMGLLLLTAWAVEGHGQADTVANRLRPEALDSHQLRVIFDLAQRYAPGGEVAVALIEGETTRFYGARRTVEGVAEVDNRNSAFALGSISKVFTATLLAQAVTEGRLQLDDRVNDAYDFPFANGATFTYRQLANHTSGLPRLPPNLGLNMLNPYAAYTPEKLEEYLRNEVVTVGQGERVYSNLGFGLLAYTLTHRLDGTTYGEALDERIFNPLGMDHSSNGPDSTRAQLVPGYGANGEQVTYWSFTDAMAGAGGIVSTPEDMARFVRKQFDADNAAVILTHQPTLTFDGQRATGLGWQIVHTPSARTVYLHNGAVAGYRAFVAVDVEDSVGVVVLTNVLRAGDEVDDVGMQLLQSLSIK